MNAITHLFFDFPADGCIRRLTRVDHPGNDLQQPARSLGDGGKPKLFGKEQRVVVAPPDDRRDRIAALERQAPYRRRHLAVAQLELQLGFVDLEDVVEHALSAQHLHSFHARFVRIVSRSRVGDDLFSRLWCNQVAGPRYPVDRMKRLVSLVTW
jgi:hypothetical protein